MNKCYNYFDCDKTTCPVRETDRPCWEVAKEGKCHVFDDSVLDIIDKLENPGDACKFCIYYQKYSRLFQLFSNK